MLRECGRRLAVILNKIATAVRPGLATLKLDELAEWLIIETGGHPAFKGYRTKRDDPPFSASICTSINDEVVHAIPRPDRILKQGDIVGLDIGMRWPASQQPAASYQLPARSVGALPEAGSRKLEAGLITDMAVTVPVGRIDATAENLIAVTREALAAGIRTLRPGIWMGDLSHTIQQTIESRGFAVVRELVGHGVGRHLHEDPYVPNFGRPGQGVRIKEGMVLAIEPMATAGSPLVLLAGDGWTWRTHDGSLAAHFEHTIVITGDGAEILTKF